MCSSVRVDDAVCVYLLGPRFSRSRFFKADTNGPFLKSEIADSRYFCCQYSVTLKL